MTVVYRRTWREGRKLRNTVGAVVDLAVPVMASNPQVRIQVLCSWDEDRGASISTFNIQRMRADGTRWQTIDAYVEFWPGREPDWTLSCCGHAADLALFEAKAQFRDSLTADLVHSTDIVDTTKLALDVEESNRVKSPGIA